VGLGLVLEAQMFGNQIKFKLGTSGFSLPVVLVGVGLLGISATIIS
jgi:hypothetical protein